MRWLDLPTVRPGRKITKDGKTKLFWVVDGREVDGTRYRLSRDSQAEAQALARQQQEFTQQEFRLATSLPMHVLVAAAKAHGQGISIPDVVEFYQKNRPKTDSVTLAHATDAYVFDREKIRKCGSGVAQMKNIFGRICEGFGDRPLHEIRSKEIEDWLLLQQRDGGWKRFGRIGDERRNTVLKLFRALFTFASAKARGWVATDHNPAKDVALIAIHRPEPCTLSVEDTANLLLQIRSFPRDVQAYSYLRIFSPLRRCEFSGLDWSHLKDRNLRVLGKGKRRRSIELEKVCMAHLKPLIKTSGPILERHLSKADDYLREAFAKIGLRPESVDDTNDFNPTKNILRHSACTYLHLLHGAATAARWAGHSEDIQQEHYLGLRDKDEATQWRQLSPQKIVGG